MLNTIKYYLSIHHGHKVIICRGKYSEYGYLWKEEREKTGPSKGYAGSNICSPSVLDFFVFNYICEAKVAKS